MGCLRLRGSARAMDMAKLCHDQAKGRKRLRERGAGTNWYILDILNYINLYNNYI